MRLPLQRQRQDGISFLHSLLCLVSSIFLFFTTSKRTVVVIRPLWVLPVQPPRHQHRKYFYYLSNVLICDTSKASHGLYDQPNIGRHYSCFGCWDFVTPLSQRSNGPRIYTGNSTHKTFVSQIKLTDKYPVAIYSIDRNVHISSLKPTFLWRIYILQSPKPRLCIQDLHCLPLSPQSNCGCLSWGVTCWQSARNLSVAPGQPIGYSSPFKQRISQWREALC